MSDECCCPDNSAATSFLQDARRNLTVVGKRFGLESPRFRDMEDTYRAIAYDLHALPAFEALLREVCTANGDGLPSPN